MAKRSEKLSEANYKSYLERHPEYVQAIGMISIENANLETALADLMGAVLDTRYDVARAIYFAPRAALLRIEILEAAANSRLRPKRRGEKFYENEIAKARALEKVNALIGRAKSAVGKRHEVIHDVWGVDDETGKVVRGKISQHKDMKPAPIETLNTLVSNFRKAIMTAHDLRREIRRKPPTLIDMQREPRGTTQQ